MNVTEDTVRKKVGFGRRERKRDGEGRKKEEEKRGDARI